MVPELVGLYVLQFSYATWSPRVGAGTQHTYGYLRHRLFHFKPVALGFFPILFVLPRVVKLV